MFLQNKNMNSHLERVNVHRNYPLYIIIQNIFKGVYNRT